MSVKTGAKIGVNDKNHVFEIELKEEFRKAKEMAMKRRQKALEIVDKKYDETIEFAENLPEPKIPKYPIDQLRLLACDHYNALWFGRGEESKRAAISDDESFLNRISVNFLRHELSNYDYELSLCKSKIGTIDAKIIIREKILDKISKIYPFLSEECSRQMGRNL